MSKSILTLTDGPSAGYRWLNGATKKLPPDAIAAKVLCKSHNERLSDLDTVGLRVFAALRACTLGESGPTHLIANGHDFERWMIQRAAAVMYSSNALFDGQLIDVGGVASEAVRVALLEGVWPENGGLYLMDLPPQAKFDGIEMAPIFGGPVGARLNQLEPFGFRISLAAAAFAVRWIADADIHPISAAAFFAYRPEGILLQGPEHRLELRFTWRADVKASGIVQLPQVTRERLAEARRRSSHEAACRAGDPP